MTAAELRQDCLRKMSKCTGANLHEAANAAGMLCGWVEEMGMDDMAKVLRAKFEKIIAGATQRVAVTTERRCPSDFYRDRLGVYHKIG